jgi:hypothetical protein
MAFRRPSSSSVKVWHLLILALIGTGFVYKAWLSLTTIWQFLLQILIPFLLVGTVVYLWKFPPRWLRKLSLKQQPYSRSRKKNKHVSYPQIKKKPRPLRLMLMKKSKKEYPFRVIDGKKKKSLRIVDSKKKKKKSL